MNFEGIGHSYDLTAATVMVEDTKSCSVNSDEYDHYPDQIID